MGRGTIFHISEHPECAFKMHETSFHKRLDVLGVKDVQDERKDLSIKNVAYLVRRLQSAGFVVEKCEPFANRFYGGQVEGCYSIQTGCAAELMQRRTIFFQRAFYALRAQVMTMSIEDFANDAQLATDLRLFIENTYNDAVYYEENRESIYSLDDFIRKMKANTVYYIMPETVYMY